MATGRWILYFQVFHTIQHLTGRHRRPSRPILPQRKAASRFLSCFYQNDTFERQVKRSPNREPLDSGNTRSFLCACVRARTHTHTSTSTHSHAHGELSVSWPIDQCWQIADTPGVLIRGPIRTYLHTHTHTYEHTRAYTQRHIGTHSNKLFFFFFSSPGFNTSQSI